MDDMANSYRVSVAPNRPWPVAVGWSLGLIFDLLGKARVTGWLRTSLWAQKTKAVIYLQLHPGHSHGPHAV